MRLLALIYIIVTLAIAAPMLVHGLLWGSAALIIGSALGFAGGSGLRGALYLGQRKTSIIIGMGLLFGAMALVFYSHVVVTLVGVPLSGDVWVFLGFAVGFLAATPADAGAERRV